MPPPWLLQDGASSLEIDLRVWSAPKVKADNSMRLSNLIDNGYFSALNKKALRKALDHS